MRELAPLRMPGPGLELVVLVFAATIAFITVPLALGGIGLSWDALNHQVYLGWIANEPRFDRDFLAASFQSFQYPYLYWPLYMLVQSGASGAFAGAVLVALNVITVPALWIAARAMVPEHTWFGLAMRWLAVALGYLSCVVLSLFDTTSNDLMAAAPLVWAVAVALMPASAQGTSLLSPVRAAALSGALAGVSVAFKLSNGPLAILLPLLWAIPGSTMRDRIRAAAAGCAAALAGFTATYGYWGWQLWEHMGNPTFPFMEPWFATLRTWLGQP